MAKAKPVKKKKMSKPALVASIIAIVLVLALVAALLFTSGFFFRVQKGATSDNFEVNASMMEYFANSYVENWYSNNYYYILIGYISFNPQLPYNQQYTDASKTQTYYDFFVEGTKLSVETYLKYCEAAKLDTQVDFGKLEDEAEQYAKDIISQLKEAAQKQSDEQYKTNGVPVSFSEYLHNNFGKHVNESDLKKALIIEHIAASYYEIIRERKHDGITEKREDEYFEDHLSTFITAEYLIYTLSSKKSVVWPEAEDYVGGVESKAYKAKIEGLKAEEAAKIKPEDYEGGAKSTAYLADYKTAEENKKANEESLATDKAVIERLANAKTAEEFKQIILDEKFESSFTSAYTTATSKYDSKNKLSDDYLKALKEEFKQAILAAALAEEEDIDAELIKIDDIKLDFYEDRYASHFTSAYNILIKDWAAEDKPSEEVLNAFKSDELKAAIIKAVVDGKEDIEDASILSFPEGSSAKWKENAKGLTKTIVSSLKEGATKWAEAAQVLPKSTITNLKTILTNATKTASHTLTSRLGATLFGGVKGQYGIEYEENEDKNGTNAEVNSHWYWDVLEMNVENGKLSVKIAEAAIAELEAEIAKETDADKKASLEAEKKSLETSLETTKKNLETAEKRLANVEKTSEYYYSAYFVTEAAHRDETKVRNVGHILFKVDATKDTNAGVSYKTSEEAKAAAESLLAQIRGEANLTKEKFEEYGSVTHDSKVYYEDITKGQMVEEFEDWLFAATTVGELGLVETEYGWHIIYYDGESGEIAWRVAAQDGAAEEEVTSWYDGLPDYSITFNDGVFEQIFEDRIQ